MREWRHFEAMENGGAWVINDGRLERCRYEWGVTTTGRQRVFQFFYVAVELDDGTREMGEDAHNLVDALRGLGMALAAMGIRLFAVGLDKRFYETALSHNTGFGYAANHDGKFHIMDVPPYPRLDPNGESYVADMIREAVGGMCKRPPFPQKHP